jgi:hypothetical protein
MHRQKTNKGMRVYKGALQAGPVAAGRHAPLLLAVCGRLRGVVRLVPESVIHCSEDPSGLKR